MRSRVTQGRVRIMKRLRVPLEGTAAYADEGRRTAAHTRYPFFFDELGHFTVPSDLQATDTPPVPAKARKPSPAPAAAGGTGGPRYAFRCSSTALLLLACAPRLPSALEFGLSEARVSRVEYMFSTVRVFIVVHLSAVGSTPTTESRGSRAVPSTRATCSAVSHSARHATPGHCTDHRTS